MTGRGNNTYLIARDAGPAALIDAGVGDARHLESLQDALAARGATLADVLVTHAHTDHASGAPALASAHCSAVFRKYPWPEEDARYPVAWQPVEDEQEIDAGSQRLRVLVTPGHSPDHVVFWHEESRSAFAGDLVTQGSSVMIQWSRGGDLIQYLAALERLLAMAPRTIYPAHGPIVSEPMDLLKAYLTHRRMRERQVMAALQSGRATVHDIADSIYHGVEPSLMPAARENVRAHLEKLRHDGRASASEDGVLWRPGLGSPAS